MNILILYDQFSTYTETVYQHLKNFATNSIHKHYFVHASNNSLLSLNMNMFDVVVIHYSLRVPHDHISKKLYLKIRDFSGLKVLFLQDEYEYTNKIREAINYLELRLVYTTVPKVFINKIYPKNSFLNVTFISTLTGFALEPHTKTSFFKINPIKERSVTIGYRGNDLPFWYGDLGEEKRSIARIISRECIKRNIHHDISFATHDRIYGKNWTRFIENSKVILGTESGCNIFDDDGKIKEKVLEYTSKFPSADYKTIKMLVWGDTKEVMIMNQISPRIFEAIYHKTALLLFEGHYSGIIKPYKHYIPLKKDLSNLDWIFDKISNDDYLQALADRAYSDIILPCLYTGSKFMQNYDRQLTLMFRDLMVKKDSATFSLSSIPNLSTTPKRNPLVQYPKFLKPLRNFLPKSIVVFFKLIIIWAYKLILRLK